MSCVVVWEWQGGGRWVPHAPGVSRTLERAHDKQLTRVVLADAEPALCGHSVNLRTLTQTADTEEGVIECRVRRACYSMSSPAGRGVRWEWADDEGEEPLPMEAQCRLEAGWAAGGSVALDGGAAWPQQLRARTRAGHLRALRRVPQPPYPRARAPPDPPRPPDPPAPPARTPIEGRRARIPQQHTGSSVQSVQSAPSVHGVPPARSGWTRPGARSASPRERKPGLARQILHNLNIFSNNNKPTTATNGASKRESRESRESKDARLPRGRPPAPPSPRAPPARDLSGSTRSTRRHSVDTVSTYLSHESKDSLPPGPAVAELLNVSAGSDDVFESAPPPAADHPGSDTGGGGGEEDWVRGVTCPQWGAVCPACLAALAPGPAHAPPEPVVALTGCQHMLHLRCLHRQLDEQRAQGEPPHVECLVCGRVYDVAARAEEGAGAAGGGEAPEAEGGEQPPGSMAWSLQPGSLASHPGAGTILVTYNFQSGRQAARHPRPGAPYYAVGFPRQSALPDTALGRAVLAALRAAWARRALFTVCASRTTGREHVVAWRVAPPPAAQQYRAGHAQAADHALALALQRLRAL